MTTLGPHHECENQYSIVHKMGWTLCSDGRLYFIELWVMCVDKSEPKRRQPFPMQHNTLSHLAYGSRTPSKLAERGEVQGTREHNGQELR